MSSSLRPVNCPTPGSSVLHYLLEFAQTHVHWVDDASNHLILWHPFLLLASIFPSIQVFSNEMALCITRPKYWSFSMSPSNEYSGLISFMTDWFVLLAVQRTFRSLFQHHSSKASILQHSDFFMVLVSDPYITGKTIALTRRTSVIKVISLGLFPLFLCHGWAVFEVGLRTWIHILPR